MVYYFHQDLFSVPWCNGSRATVKIQINIAENFFYVCFLRLFLSWFNNYVFRTTNVLKYILNISFTNKSGLNLSYVSLIFLLILSLLPKTYKKQKSKISHKDLVTLWFNLIVLIMLLTLDFISSRFTVATVLACCCCWVCFLSSRCGLSKRSSLCLIT